MTNVHPSVGSTVHKQLYNWKPYETHNIQTPVVLKSLDLCPPSPPIRTPRPPSVDDESTIMTGRQDNPVVSLKADSAHKENLQGHDNLQRQQDTKQHRKSNGVASKPLRPPIELYTPRNNLKKSPSKLGVSANNADDIVNTQLINRKEQLSKSSSKVHFVSSPPKKVSPPPSLHAGGGQLQSALKRSKSFTADDGKGWVSLGFDRDAFPLEYQGLIRQAVLDPNSLSCQKLMELVRLICSKAIESAQHASPAAQLCFSIIEKEHDHTFLESLQNCCREWYNERDKLLRSPFLNSVGPTSAGMRRWTAYVSFLIELYFYLKKMHSPMGGDQPLGPHPNSPLAHLSMTLQTLLYECANIMLRPASLNSEGEVETLRGMLTRVGRHLESDCALRMENLVMCLRDAFLLPSLPAQVRKSLLEVLELHACAWEMDLPQTLYYFPYTRM